MTKTVYGFPQTPHAEWATVACLQGLTPSHARFGGDAAGWLSGDATDLHSGGFGWSLGRDTMYEDFRGFLQPLQANAEIICRLGHDRFLPNPFQFVIHQSSHYSTLYIVCNTERIA
jgi:hypothetical protein